MGGEEIILCARLWGNQSVFLSDITIQNYLQKIQNNKIDAKCLKDITFQSRATRLYTSLCPSIGRLIGRSVTFHFFLCFQSRARDSTTRFVGPSVRRSVRPSVRPSIALYFFWGFCGFWPYCSCPNDLVYSITAPAHQTSGNYQKILKTPQPPAQMMTRYVIMI